MADLNHKSWCTYPADPCDCGAVPNFNGDEAHKRRVEKEKEHKPWCDWPSGPCDCGADKIEE